MSRRAKDIAIKGYIRLPKELRKHTDKVVRKRSIYVESLDKRAEKGKKFVEDRARKIIGLPKRKRR